MSACLDSPGPFTTQPMTATRMSSTPGRVSLPLRHPGLQVGLDLLGHLLEERRRRPPAARAGADTWGRNERSPIDWRTCWAISTSSFARRRREPGVSETRIVSPIPSSSRIARPAVEADDPLVAEPRLGQAEMQRVVGSRGEQPVDVDEVAHLRDLRADDDPVVAQAGLLGQLRRAHRRLDHRLDHHVAGVARLGGRRVLVHQLGQEGLVERAPVDADPDGLAVVDRDPDDRREVLVVALRPDIARVDPVLGEGPGRFAGTRPGAGGRCSGSRR